MLASNASAATVIRAIHCQELSQESPSTVAAGGGPCTEKSTPSAVADSMDRDAIFQYRKLTPGMLNSARALLARESHPDRDAIVEALSANYCRCTGYEPIIDAVLAAGQRSREVTP